MNHLKISLAICSQIFLALVFCVSCQESGTTAENSGTGYFDLSTLIQDQIMWLDSLNPKVKKMAMIDSQREEKTDTVNWDAELIFLKQSDLNRPYLLGTYGTKEINENEVKKTIYQPLDSTDLGIVQLVIHTDSGSGQIKKLESVYEERNLLFDNWRKITLHFSLQEGSPRPTSYKLEGWQKVIFKDRVDYLIEAEVLY